MSRLRDGVVQNAGTRGLLALYKLDRATEITCALRRALDHQVGRRPGRQLDRLVV